MPDTSEWYSDGLRFTCTQCGNCCTGPPGFVWFSDEEARAIAGKLEISLREFYQKYTKKIGSHLSLDETATEHGFDCVFLRRDDEGRAQCSIYEVRPQQCRTWPFWPENLSSRRAYRGASQRCPGMQRGLEGEGNFYPLEKIRIIRDSNPT